MALYNTGVLYGSGAVYGPATPPIERKHKKMALPSDDLIGFITEVKTFLMQNQAAIAAKGYDPTAAIARLGTDCATFGTEDREQEAIKTALKDKTTRIEGIAYGLYTDGSSVLDAVIGALGKTTEKAKEAAQIRSKLSGRTPRTPTPPAP